ncbi:MAG TPA: type II toxin-antitoxin system RelE/ParE family toxin [Tepidisphaeraceae bacterium]|jgi:addiction module RelE/StbE family toxin|nr:type II toxin-antitoxin system RelE/ParE family toxin [Tepidisphaeraceae bacterium]
MPDAYQIRITPRASSDLECIFDYIRLHSPDGAASMIQQLMDSIDTLNIFPHRYNVPRTGYVRGRQIRSMPVPPYLVRYRIDERRKAIHILRVRHGARNS